MTTFDTDPNTQTIAAGWASSPLGQPEHEVRYGFTPTGPAESIIDEPTSDSRRALLAAALAAGVIGGAALGVMLFDFTDSVQPTVVMPRSEGRLPGPPVALPTELRPAPDNAPDPNIVVSEQGTASAPAVAVPPRGQGPADVGAPPPVGIGDTTVIVDIPIPDYPPLPETPEDDTDDPEPPEPEPPVLDDPTFTLPEPPDPVPDPDPDPPTFLPDLPLAPLPDPDPVLELPAPSAGLNPQPEPPSFGPSLPDFSLDFDPPAGFGS